MSEKLTNRQQEILRLFSLDDMSLSLTSSEFAWLFEREEPYDKFFKEGVKCKVEGGFEDEYLIRYAVNPNENLEMFKSEECFDDITQVDISFIQNEDENTAPLRLMTVYQGGEVVVELVIDEGDLNS